MTIESFKSSGIDYSGEKGKPIRYSAYGGEVVFSGGKTFDLNEFECVSDESVLEKLPQSSRDKVLCLDLEKKGITDYGEISTYGSATDLLDSDVDYVKMQQGELFFSGEPMTIARYPNIGYEKVGEVINDGLDSSGKSTVFSFRGMDSKTSSWKDEDQLQICGFWGSDWLDLSCGADISEDGIFTSHIPSPQKVVENQRFYVYNLMQELDAPGEYYIDRNTDMLYFYPPKNSGKVTLSLLDDDIFKLSNTDNIIIENIHFDAGRNNGLDIGGCNNITVRNCTFSNMGNMGIVSQYCKNSTISENKVYNCGKGGIYSDGYSASTLEKTNNIVSDNTVYNFARLRKTYSPGIRMGGVGDIMRRNEIYDSPHLGVVIHGNDNIIEYNNIHDCLKESDDCGAVYMGRSKIQRGNVFKNNYFHDMSSEFGVGKAAIYLDDGWDNVEITGNVFSNMAVGVWINGGRNNIVKNNIFSDISVSDIRTSAILLQFYENNYSGFEETFSELTKSAYQLTAPYSKYDNFSNILFDEPLVPKYNVVKENIDYGCVQKANEITLLNLPENSSYTKEDIFSENIYNDVYSFTQDPGFKDYVNNDFTVDDKSIIQSIYPDFVFPNFEGIKKH